MVIVTGGQFQMGSNDGDQDSKPSHTVTLRSFRIDKYEVTSEDYKKFVGATGRPAPPGWTQGNYPTGMVRQPVTGVSWEDDNAFCHMEGGVRFEPVLQR